MALTAIQVQALRLVKEREIKGTCERYVWRFTDGHCAYTGAVKKLAAQGLVSIDYFPGGSAAVNITEAGERLV